MTSFIEGQSGHFIATKNIACIECKPTTDSPSCSVRLHSGQTISCNKDNNTECYERLFAYCKGLMATGEMARYDCKK